MYGRLKKCSLSTAGFVDNPDIAFQDQIGWNIWWPHWTQYYTCIEPKLNRSRTKHWAVFQWAAWAERASVGGRLTSSWWRHCLTWPPSDPGRPPWSALFTDCLASMQRAHLIRSLSTSSQRDRVSHIQTSLHLHTSITLVWPSPSPRL